MSHTDARYSFQEISPIVKWKGNPGFDPNPGTLMQWPHDFEKI